METSGLLKTTRTAISHSFLQYVCSIVLELCSYLDMQGVLEQDGSLTEA